MHGLQMGRWRRPPVRRGLSTTHIILIVIGSLMLGACCVGSILAGILLPAIGQAQIAENEAKSQNQIQQVLSANAIRLGSVADGDAGEMAGADAEGWTLSTEALIEGNYITPSLLDSPFGPVADAGEDYWTYPGVLHPERKVRQRVIVMYDRAMYAERNSRIAVGYLDGTGDLLPLDVLETAADSAAAEGVDFNLPGR